MPEVEHDHPCVEGDLIVCIDGTLYGPCDWEACGSPCESYGSCPCKCHGGKPFAVSA